VSADFTGASELLPVALGVRAGTAMVLEALLATGACSVLACARSGTEVASVVQHCGLVVPPEDPESFYKALSILIDDSTLRQTLGLAGAEYALNHLSQDRILAGFESKLREICQST
jgi:colanic acid biosynthesis glycosyl transferase WcaI